MRLGWTFPAFAQRRASTHDYVSLTFDYVIRRRTSLRTATYVSTNVSTYVAYVHDNAERFLAAEACRGSVLAQLPDGWKTNVRRTFECCSAARRMETETAQVPRTDGHRNEGTEWRQLHGAALQSVFWRMERSDIRPTQAHPTRLEE